MLKDYNGLNRQYSLIEKTCNLGKMPAAVYKGTARKLLQVDDMGELGRPIFEEILMDVWRQYGKEEIRRQVGQDEPCLSTAVADNDVIQ